MDRVAQRVITSQTFEDNLIDVFDFGLKTFGYFQANTYFNSIESIVKSLETDYPFYPECRHLTTKNRIYRNIILDAHLIIYRITKKQIEVLDILHSTSSISKIQKTRSIKI